VEYAVVLLVDVSPVPPSLTREAPKDFEVRRI
jgi:hypothetical protein